MGLFFQFAVFWVIKVIKRQDLISFIDTKKSDVYETIVLREQPSFCCYG